MNIEQVNKTFENRQKGTFFSMAWTRTCEIKQTYKKQGIVITKTSHAVLQYGVNYDNKKSVQIKRENGELPAENQGLPWGYWYQYPLIIAKDNKDGTTDFYVRGGTTENNYIKSEYEINGKKATYNEVESMLLAKEKPNGKKPDVINVKIDNINYIK